MTIKLTWFGTAAHVLELDGTRLFFDPFFERNERSTPVLKTKREDVKDIDAIFISHGHFDHCTDAGWYAENLDVPVYCSETAKDNMIRWAGGEIIEEKTHQISEKGKNNIKPIDNFERIKINNDVEVEAIKSKHVKFDAETIWARLKSKEFWKEAKEMLVYGKGFPMGKVFGYCVYYKDKKIVIFGSLYHKYKDVLEKYADCDVFLPPLAGNSKKHLAKKGGKMVEILNPKIVVPLHWDNFFPPISRTEDLNPFFKYMEKNHPNIKITMPTIDEAIDLELA